MIYELVTINTPEGEVKQFVIRDDKAMIPCNLENSDYQQYLKQLEESSN